MEARDDVRVLAVCGLAFEAAVANGPGVATLCGIGAAQLEARLEALLDAWSPAQSSPQSSPQLPPQLPRFCADPPARLRGIISFGCAGALDPALAPGSCVVASAVECGGERLAADPAWLRALLVRLPGACLGYLAGLDAPLLSSADKARLWTETGALAVDMESHVAARAARRHGLPFAACRVVLDPAWRSIPPCALAGMRADGASAPLALLADLARDPRQLAPLCALVREAWLARRALRRVRARLGFALALPAPPARV